MTEHRDGRKRRVPTEAPFGTRGLLHWSEDGYGARGGVQWRPNAPFTATMRFKAWNRGRSSVRAVWEDGDGLEWGMFLDDTEQVFADHVIDHGAVTATWIVRCHTGYYAVRLADGSEIPGVAE